MTKLARMAVAVAIALLGTVALAACGSSSNGNSNSNSTSKASATSQSIPLKAGENPVGQQLYGKKRGGTLTVYASEDFEHLDPGEAYFVEDYAVMYVTQRPLFIFLPNSEGTLAPDLATALPTVANGGITDGGKTITVHIQQGVHFSPPVNREVTSADVAYAIERGAKPNVTNPYFPSYFGAGAPAPLVGAQSTKYQGGPIPGIQTPNKSTIVFHLTKPGSTMFLQALSLPLSSPVPEEFAGPMDTHSPTTYGTEAEVATGPYMLESNLKTGQFAGLGYQTGKSLTLVRNPNWNPNTYTSAYKPPAYLDRIDVNIGGDASVIGPQVLKGSDSIQLDTPSQSIIKLAYESYPSQITFTPGAGDHYVAIDNQHGVFTDINLRKAFWAALDREAIVKARGGPLVAEPMTHFLYPGDQGFDQAGGLAGPVVDYNSNPAGNHAVACKYMKLAGYANCKYTGGKSVQVVSSTNGDDPAIAQIVNSALTSLGFATHVSLVDQSVMYSKYCQVPKQEIDACPAQGWVRDFADPLGTLYAPFYGPSITPSGNPNEGQVNDPAINAAMVKAAAINTPAARDQAWANVDKMLVADAAAVPEEYDNQPNIDSKDVAGVDDIWNIGTWDFAFTSLKTP
ncbi:MAG TPA: ABC transporter substrate-binding protein [Solirubrobacteraceae bacterium]|jgi:peptide/nickel transport system substrate-binding protein|nr:ABC transporter substrate-binding protein [Solirubrobacteraceae bacterium]